MSDMVTISLNGQEVSVPAGITIRAAAELQGISIPTFCYDDRLKPFTSCYLCVVEVEGARGMTTSCSTLVAAGMKVKTNSQKVMDSRKMNLDLILSDHAGDCIAPCEATCPSNVDIQGYIAHVSTGNFAAATKLIKEQNPLPVVCGRICPHPCEAQCRRALVDEPVAINPIKPYLPPCAPDTGKQVAVVGGGPAGLSAAYYLRQQGHGVTIYEGLPQLGGMTRYGIPSFRLPWDLLDNEIKAILDLGVKVAIGESPGFGSTEGAIEALGLTQALQHRAVPFFTFTQVRYYRTRIPKFPVLAIAKELSDYDGTINLPKVKTHCQTGFSGAVKNLYGCVPGKRKAIRHMTCLGDEVAFVQMILANAKEAGAFFHLADGIRCLHNHGPTSGDPHELHSLLFCEDGATLDWGLCGRIGLDPLSTLQFQLSGPPPVYVSSGEPIEPDPSFLHAAKVPVFFHPLRVARSIARQAWTKAKESVQ